MFCMVKSFALLTGLSESEVLNHLGSDPVEIVNEHRTDESRYRGVYIDELQEVAIALDYKFYCINPLPKLENGKPLWPEERLTARWEKHLSNNDGLLLGAGTDGKSHAVAWMGGKLIDPTGKINSLEEFSTQFFIIIEK